MAEKKPGRKNAGKGRASAAGISWIILIALEILLWALTARMGLLPRKWILAAAGILAAVGALTGFFALRRNSNRTGKVLSAVLNVLLCVLVALGCWTVRRFGGKIESMFQTVPSQGTMNISFYALSNAYRDAHPEIDEALGQREEGYDPSSLENYRDKTFIIQSSLDQENQDYALLYIRRELGVEELKTVEAEDLWTAIDALYQGKGDIILFNDTYQSVIRENIQYSSFFQDAVLVAQASRKLTLYSADSDLTSQPFSVYIAGNDQYGEELNLYGRTDVNMLLTVNPLTKQILVVSVPRDSFLPNPALGNVNDKLTHLGTYGIQNTMEGLGAYLGTDINNYFLVNFTTFIRIVDAVGGVDIDNPYAFSGETAGYQGTFEEGMIHLDGTAALAYCRVRYDLANGDFGRNEHQTIVLNALIEKLTSPAVITKIDQILEAIQGTFSTNIEYSSIQALCQMQLDDLAEWNIVRYSIEGTTGSSAVASAGHCNLLSIVYPYRNQIEFIRGQIDLVTAGEIITQQELPEGSGYLNEGTTLEYWPGCVDPSTVPAETTEEDTSGDSGSGESTGTETPAEEGGGSGSGSSDTGEGQDGGTAGQTGP